MTKLGKEYYISVDVETAGPAPSMYSLLSIGACTVFKPVTTFYVELQPVNENALPEALEVSRLSMEELKESGVLPGEAMLRFLDWLGEVTPEEAHPIFIAFNAPFDWMFVNDYFHRFLGQNPFGHKAIDIKSFYMGLRGVKWGETSMHTVSKYYFGNRQLTHHALRDALDQAEIFRNMLKTSMKKRQNAKSVENDNK